jgi:3alpha(or 20beta)-hydroxysteroid dehydrogenase
LGRLAGKVAIVTGGARGIGAATCRLFVEEGACVLIADVDRSGEALAGSLGESAAFVRADVTSEADWKACVDAAVARWAGIDVLVNNAAMFVFGDLLDTSKDTFERVLSVNLTGAFLGIRSVVPVMKKRGGGSIVNVSSNAGLAGGNGFGAYASSKFGLRGLTKVAAFELGRDGIRVNTVHPGSTNTPMTNPKDKSVELLNEGRQHLALPRIATAEEIARMILFVASDDCSFSTGAEFVSDGGAAAGRYYENFSFANQ